MKHLIKEFENIKLWKVVEKTISELENNKDLKLITRKEHIVGYICKQIIESNLTVNNLSENL